MLAEQSSRTGLHLQANNSAGSLSERRSQKLLNVRFSGANIHQDTYGCRTVKGKRSYLPAAAVATDELRPPELLGIAIREPAITVIGIDIGKNSFHVVGLDKRGAIALRQKWSRGGIINQIRAFLLECGVAVRQGLRFLRAELPGILATRTDVLSPRMVHVIEGLADDWRRLDECIEGLSTEIGALACQDPACDRLMTVPGIGPIVSSAMVAAIGNGAAFAKGRDFGAWLGLVMTANASWPLSQRQALRDLDRPGVPTVEKPVRGASVG